MYLLLRKHMDPRYGEVQVILYKSDDLVTIANTLTDFVKQGCRPDDLMIVKKVNFEFKCSVNFEREKEECLNTFYDGTSGENTIVTPSFTNSSC